MKKLIFGLFILSFFSIQLIFPNQKILKEEKIKSQITNYEQKVFKNYLWNNSILFYSEKSTEQSTKVKHTGFLAMGIVGTVCFVGCLLVPLIIAIPAGLGVMGYIVLFSWWWVDDSKSVNQSISNYIEPYTPIMVSFFLCGFFIFLPMMIVGYAVNHVLRKKKIQQNVAIFIENQKTYEMTLGLKIKI